MAFVIKKSSQSWDRDEARVQEQGDLLTFEDQGAKAQQSPRNLG